MSRFTIHPSLVERQNGRLVEKAYGSGDQGKDWFTSVTDLMDAHPELYPTARDARQQLGAQCDTMTPIEIAQWRLHHRFPFPITRATATTRGGRS